MNLYDTLGVAPDADDATIKKAFRRKASEHHPDRGGDTAAMQKLNDAYAVLADPARRERYDQTGQTAAEPPREDKARTALAQAINEVVDLIVKRGDDVAHVDPVQVTREQLRSNRQQNATHRGTLLKRIAQRKVALSRLQRTHGEGPDVVVLALQDTIAGLQQEVTKVDEMQDLIDDILVILDGYRYRTDPKPQATAPDDFHAALQRAFAEVFGGAGGFFTG